MALPPECCSPASITGGSVESNTSGSAAWVAKRDAISLHVDGAVAADVVDADVEDVRAFLHLLAWPSARRCPSRSSSIASRNFFEPFAFVRSPIARYASSWWNGTGL